MKNCIKKSLKASNGITLIALVITIIVILILAGISIGMLNGENSIIKNAGNAKVNSEIAEEKEIIEKSTVVAMGKSKYGNLDKGYLNTELEKYSQIKEVKEADEGILVTFKSNRAYIVDSDGNVVEHIPNIQLLADSNNVEYPLPNGARYKEGTVDTGLVITYKGSDFVWIPIQKDTLYAKGTTKAMAKLSIGTDDNGKDKYEGILYDKNLVERESTYYKEPTDIQDTTYGDWSTTADRGFDLIIRHIDEYKELENNNANQEIIKMAWAKQLQEEYDAMIESVKKYGGFFIGRYETSWDGTSVASINGAEPMSEASLIDTYAQTWYGLYQRQKNFTTSSDSMVASMMWGSQYTAMLNWAQASGTSTATHVTETGYGNHTNVVKDTGETSTDVINKIYDLEGNMNEWTLECFYRQRIVRGYDGNGNYNPALFISRYPYASDGVRYGSRLTLYIK